SLTMTARGRRTAFAGFGVLAAAALALTACAPPNAAAPDPSKGSDGGSDTLTVGYISPTTGNFAVAGQEMVDGWNLYWENNGGKAGDVTIKTVEEDDAGNPETSLTKAHKLVEQDKVDIIVGPLIANTALAVAEYTSTVGIPNLHPVAASDDLTQRNHSGLTVRTGSMGGSQANYP